MKTINTYLFSELSPEGKANALEVNNYINVLEDMPSDPKEYEFLTSDEQVAETLISNEYYFLSNGELT